MSHSLSITENSLDFSLSCELILICWSKVNNIVRSQTLCLIDQDFICFVSSGPGERPAQWRWRSGDRQMGRRAEFLWVESVQQGEDSPWSAPTCLPVWVSSCLSRFQWVHWTGPLIVTTFSWLCKQTNLTATEIRLDRTSLFTAFTPPALTLFLVIVCSSISLSHVHITDKLKHTGADRQNEQFVILTALF